MIADIFRKILTKNDPQADQQWAPAPRNYVADKTLEAQIYNQGYAIAGKLDAQTTQQLQALYTQTHNFDKPTGGMFYSLYSRDVEYRKQVHHNIGSILQPVYDSLFTNYRSVINSFIIKVSGPQSEFSLHQDSTSIDERNYSNLSVWIPLQDTDMNNGCLCVVPQSHKIFSPFRGMSFSPPFQNISDTVRKYLQPLPMKAGEILLFDNRLVHNSGINQSGADRVVIMSGIYPQDVPVISCYKDEQNPKSDIELIEQSEDFLITYENFMHDCTCRPETGKSIGFVKWHTGQMSESTFVAQCKKYGIEPTNIEALMHPAEVQAVLDSPTSAG